KLSIVRRGLRRLVFVSEPLREACVVSMRLPECMTDVITNAVDPNRFVPGAVSSLRTELGIPADAFLVGWVGRLQSVNRLETMLEAAAILKASAPGYRFAIIGSGTRDYTAQLVALRDRLGLTNEVTFVGARDDVRDAMAAFDLYALTSRSEGFSLSTVEAM